MTPPDAPCPYVGLQPFREEDYPYFFGRERDIRVISSNLREQPLTVVYGASGVGKSSVLRAGVLPHLRTDTGAVAVYYNTWQSDAFLEDLTGRCRTALGVNDPDVRLDKLVASGSRRLFLLLDQFEELLLYHRTGEQAEEFDSLLARIVNRDDLAANVLIGIREDALSRFDQRFSIRIADLLANTLPLEHLNNDAARRAMIEPLRVFNERHSLGTDGYSMEPELAEEILQQVQPRRFAEAEEGGASASGPGRVETPFLQLVLRRLWEEEIQARSHRLRMQTLKGIGGARQIVDKHVNDVLASLPRGGDREIVARMFRYLVTPSRSKIAQDTESLIGYGEAPEADARKVLSWLSDKPESRILRRLETPERYEIFHDVLAQPILDWRKKYFAERERIEEERKRRRLQLLAGAMMLLALVAVGFALFALDQRRKAREAADLVRIQNQKTIAATNDAQAAHAQADSTAAALRARQAELAGRTAEAAKLEAAANDYAKQAQTYRSAAEEARESAAGYLEGKDKNYRDAVQQIEALRRERDQLQTWVASLLAEAEKLKKPPVEKENPAKQSEPKGVPAVKPPEPPAASFKLLRTLEGHSGGVQGVAVSPDGRRAVSASSDKTLKVWDLETGRAVRTLTGHESYVNGVAVTPDGRRAVSASYDKTLKVWDLETGRALRTLTGHSGYVFGVAVSPDGRRAISGSLDETLKMWDLETGGVLLTLKGHSGAVHDVAVTPDGRWGVSASSDKTLKVWDLESGRALRTLIGHSQVVQKVALAPDGRWGVSASPDDTLRVWDLESGRALRTLIGPASLVAVSPDGRWALTTSFGLAIWDLVSGTVVATFRNEARFTGCAFAGAGRVVAGDVAGRVHVLSLELPGNP